MSTVLAVDVQKLGLWKEEPEVLTFLQAVTGLGPFGVVVELGAYAMHDHNPRPLFPGAQYIGVDARKGPGVDVAELAHLYTRGHPKTADLVLSISALEHDPHATKTIWGAVECARLGGLVALSYPTGAWEEHELDCSPGGEHYRNPDPQEVRDLLALQCDVVLDWISERTCLPHWPRHNIVARRLR